MNHQFEYRLRMPSEPEPFPVQEPPDPPENPDMPAREPDPEIPAKSSSSVPLSTVNGGWFLTSADPILGVDIAAKDRPLPRSL